MAKKNPFDIYSNLGDNPIDWGTSFRRFKRHPLDETSLHTTYAKLEEEMADAYSPIYKGEIVAVTRGSNSYDGGGALTYAVPYIIQNNEDGATSYWADRIMTGTYTTNLLAAQYVNKYQLGTEYTGTGKWYDVKDTNNKGVDPVTGEPKDYVTTTTYAEIFNDYENNVATGAYSHAEGQNNLTEAPASHVGGSDNKIIAGGDNSTVAGSNNTVSGSDNNVAGKKNTINGNRNTVTGEGNSADTSVHNSFIGGNANSDSAPNSAMIGAENNNGANGDNSIVGGTNNTNNTPNSIVFGHANDNQGPNSNVIGETNTNTGDNSFVNGKNNANDGDNSIVAGNGNQNSGDGSIVGGTANTVNGAGSIVGGYQNTTYNVGEGAIGNYAHSYDAYENGIGTSFVIGNGDYGTYGNKPHNAFEVWRDGTTYTFGTAYAWDAYTGTEQPLITREELKRIGLNKYQLGTQYTGVGQWYDVKGVDNSNPDDPSSIKTTGTYAEIFNDYINNTATGKFSHAEGTSTKAQGAQSHAEGFSTTTYAAADNSHAEGSNSFTMGAASHAEGISTGAIGDGSHSEGDLTTANGNYSHAEGASTTAQGAQSHAEGFATIANGKSAHAEGSKTQTDGEGAHAEGINTYALAVGTHSEGNGTYATAQYAHAEGDSTTASGNASHSSGIQTVASGNYSHAEGRNTYATANSAHSEGINTRADGMYSHAEGNMSYANSQSSHAEGLQTYSGGVASHSEGVITATYGKGSHAEGLATVTYGTYSHAEGVNARTTSAALSSHAEGFYTTTDKKYAHAEGAYTYASADAAHAEGAVTVAYGRYSHAEGYASQTIAQGSHAEGSYTVAHGTNSHAEGSYTYSNADMSHTEGLRTSAYGSCSHAEGSNTVAKADNSHSEGNLTYAAGNASHAEGSQTSTYGDFSHAEGSNTIAKANNSHAEGNQTYAAGIASHAEGSNTYVFGNYSHAEGFATYAAGDYAHAGGKQTYSAGQYSLGHGYGVHTYNDAEVAFGNWNRSYDASEDYFYRSKMTHEWDPVTKTYTSNGIWPNADLIGPGAGGTLFTIGDGKGDCKQELSNGDKIAYRHNILQVNADGSMMKHGTSYFMNDVFGPVSYTYVESLGISAYLTTVLSALLENPKYTRPKVETSIVSTGVTGTSFGSATTFYTNSTTFTVEVGSKFTPTVRWRATYVAPNYCDYDVKYNTLLSNRIGYSEGVTTITYNYNPGGTSAGLSASSTDTYTAGNSTATYTAMGDTKVQNVTLYGLTYKNLMKSTIDDTGIFSGAQYTGTGTSQKFTGTYANATSAPDNLPQILVGNENTYTLYQMTSYTFRGATQMYFQQLADKMTYVTNNGLAPTDRFFNEDGSDVSYTATNKTTFSVVGSFKVYWGSATNRTFPTASFDVVKNAASNTWITAKTVGSTQFKDFTVKDGTGFVWFAVPEDMCEIVQYKDSDGADKRSDANMWWYKNSLNVTGVLDTTTNPAMGGICLASVVTANNISVCGHKYRIYYVYPVATTGKINAGTVYFKFKRTALSSSL